MTVARRFNSLLHLCAFLGTVAFGVADEKPLLTLLAVAATIACALWSRWRLIAAERVERASGGGAASEIPLPMLPRAASNLLVVAAIANVAIRASGNIANEEFVSTLGQFLVFLVLIKMLDRRAPRDDAQLIILTVFIAIAALLTSGSLPVGLLLIAFVPSAIGASMLWQVRAGEVMLAGAAADNRALAASLAGGPAPGAPAGAPRAVSGRRTRRDFFGLAASCVLVSCAVATVVFVLVPRGIGSDLFGRFGMGPQPQIGFREAVRLGEAGFLSASPTPVMDVQLTTGAGETLGGSGELLYLRGAARDEYEPANRVWQDPSSGSGGDSEGVRVQLRDGYAQQLPRSGDALRRAADPSVGAVALRSQKITVRAESAGGTMFALWRPLTVTPDRPMEAHVSARNGTMRHTAPVGPNLTYTVTSALADELSASPPPPAGFRTGPIHEFASALLAQRGFREESLRASSRQAILALRDHLRTTFGYTLEMVAPPEGVDPIEFFLFERKKGHCEYFASAMAAMCQSQAIPARVITGYVATEYNSLTGQYLVRESNAHAWVEAFVVADADTGRGRWETFDASPPADIERIHRPAGGVLASLRSWYDALEFNWSSSIIGYDNSANSRSRIGRLYSTSAVAQRFDAAADRLASWLKTLRSDPKLVPWWLRSGPVLLLALVLAWTIFRRRFGNLFALRFGRRRARADLGMSPFRPTGEYARALRALRRAGLPKPEHTPPARFADELERVSPEAAAALRTVVQRFYRSHFGARAAVAGDAAAGDTDVRRLHDALRAVRARPAPRASR